MITHALVLEESPVKLWGLSSRERISRQLKAIGGVELIKPGSDLAHELSLVSFYVGHRLESTQRISLFPKSLT